MRGSVEPEDLEEILPADPRAVGSRADLRRLNCIMGHAGILSRALRHRFNESLSRARPLRLVELGAGDGTLLLRLARRLAALGDRPSHAARSPRSGFSGNAPGVRSAQLVSGECGDRCFFLDGTTGSPRGPDAGQFVSAPFPAQIIDGAIATLRNQNEPVHRLRTPSLAARTHCRPMARASWLQRHHAARRHHQRAGWVCRHELSVLWPADPGWRMSEQPAGLFSHCFIAERHG